MKFKKIVGFGDSWVWGDELLDPALVNHKWAHPILVENTTYRESNCFLGLLGQHYNIPVENFGIAGGSQQSSIWTYLWWLEHESLDPNECLVLVGHTDANRMTFYNPNHVVYPNDPPWNRFVHSSWIHNDDRSNNQEWVEMVKRHMILTDCPEFSQLTQRQTELFFAGQYHMMNHNVLQFQTIGTESPRTKDGVLFGGISLRHILDNKRHLLAPLGHPNEQGHKFLRDLLITEIERVILA